MLTTKNLTAAVLFILAGCAESTSQSTYHWRDTSGEGRSEGLALHDAQSCHKAHSVPGDAEASAEKLALERFNACMRQRGWEIVRE